jgi:hypothetical protein
MLKENNTDKTNNRNSFLRSRGAALLLTLLCLTLLSVIAMGLAGISISQSKISSNHFSSVQAYYVAEAGISQARARLAKETAVDPNWTPPPSTVFEGTVPVEGSSGSYSYTISPKASNTKSTYKVWDIESTGVIKGNNGYITAQRKISAVLESESLARYVMVIDSNPYLWGKSQTPNKYSGPMHTNGYFKFYGKPEFDSPLTSSNINDTCYVSSKNLYTQGGTNTTDPSLFYRYVYNYEQDKPVGAAGTNNFNFSGGQPTKPLPSNSTEQQNNATQVIEGNAVITMLSSGNMEVICDAGNFIYPCDGATIYVRKCGDRR